VRGFRGAGRGVTLCSRRMFPQRILEHGRDRLPGADAGARAVGRIHAAVGRCGARSRGGGEVSAGGGGGQERGGDSGEGVQRRGWGVGRTNGACVSLWGSHGGC
jgi:hypothetical protein